MSYIPLSEIIPSVKNWCRNQNLTDAKAIWGIDTAMTIITGILGIPGYERNRQFNFFEDQNFYDEADDFGEPIALRFFDDDYNRGVRNKFAYRPPQVLHAKISQQNSDTFLWGHEYTSGDLQLIAIAKNNLTGLFIDSMAENNSQNWTAYGDAENIRDDLYFQYGNAGNIGALEYDIDPALGGSNQANLVSFIGPYDWSEYLDNGYITVWHYLPTLTGYVSCSFNMSSDGVYPATNYAKITVTEQQDGSPLVVGLNKLAFPLSALVSVGSPDLTQINAVWLQDNINGSFTKTVGFRYAALSLDIPDVMSEDYYTSYKGQSSTGTPLYHFSADSDVFFIGNQGDNAIEDLIALWAAILIVPTILVDDKAARSLFSDYKTVLARRYPKKRTNNFLMEPNGSRTSKPIM